MSVPNVSTIIIDEPIISLGKQFTGDYSQSQQYVMDVQETLKKEKIDFIPFKILGIFYDNPQEKAATELRSFHALFPTANPKSTPDSLERIELKGKFLQVIVQGDPSMSIMKGYGALFNYIQQNNVQLKSNTGYQISTFEKGEMSTEILMEI
jgi:effector-binding domain-containing protein